MKKIEKEFNENLETERRINIFMVVIIIIMLVLLVTMVVYTNARKKEEKQKTKTKVERLENRPTSFEPKRTLPKSKFEINEKEFEEKVLHGKGKILVEFFGSWCTACINMEDTIEKLGEQYPIYKIESEHSTNLLPVYNIDKYPTFILFENGKEIGRIEGTKTEEEIKDMFK